MEYFGWGEDRALAASAHDLIALTARAAGNWRKKPPDIPEWPRPAKKKKPTAMTLFHKFGGAGFH